jgi:hypothetical protein
MVQYDADNFDNICDIRSYSLVDGYQRVGDPSSGLKSEFYTMKLEAEGISKPWFLSTKLHSRRPESECVLLREAEVPHIYSSLNIY